MRHIPHLVPILSALATLASPATSQMTVTGQATNAAGVAVVRSNGTTDKENLAANTNFTRFSRAQVFSQGPYTSAQTFVYPPFQIGSSKSNRVQVATAFMTTKTSGHRSMHTTDATTGAPATQKFRVTLTTTKPTHVKLDWLFYGAIYDSSSFEVKLKVDSIQKTWKLNAPGSTREPGFLFMHVNGQKHVDIEIAGSCKPGTGSAPTKYDGFNTSLACNFLEVGNGSFTIYGKGCSQGKLGSNGIPVRGSSFEINLTGDGPNKPCALLIGTSKEFHLKTPLPLELTHLGAPGCFLNVGFANHWYGTTDARGNATLQTYMSAFLPKGHFFVQWMVWDANNPSGPPKLTRGAELKF